MSASLVSAVVPTFGRPETVRRAIRSINNQTHEDIEIIVVETPNAEENDSGPALETVAEHSLTHVRTAPGVNSLAARNIGIREASGTYIAFLDDDDEWAPEKTARQVDRLDSAPPEVGASVTGNRKIGPDGQERAVYTPPHPDDVLRYQLCWNIGTFSMLMIRSEILSETGLLDKQMEGCGDQDFLVRIAREFEFDIIDEPLVFKHADDQPQLSGSYDKRARSHRRFREKYDDLASDLGATREMEAALEFSLGRVALNNQDYATASRHFASGITYQPLNTGLYLYLFVALGGPVTYPLAVKASRTGLVGRQG